MTMHDTDIVDFAADKAHGEKGFFRRLLEHWPAKIAVMLIVFVWLIPTLGLLISSFRKPALIEDSGWWTSLDFWQTSEEFCAHGISAMHT